jgi:hypothetical protein
VEIREWCGAVSGVATVFVVCYNQKQPIIPRELVCGTWHATDNATPDFTVI